MLYAAQTYKQMDGRTLPNLLSSHFVLDKDLGTIPLGPALIRKIFIFSWLLLGPQLNGTMKGFTEAPFLSGVTGNALYLNSQEQYINYGKLQ